MQDLARFRNDPSDQKILYPSHQNAQKSGQKMDLPVHKTTLASDENTSSSSCPIHDKNSNQVSCDCLKLHKKPHCVSLTPEIGYQASGIRLII